jgi:transcription termination/antitermination protein NusG
MNFNLNDNWYVMQVVTNKEEKVLNYILKNKTENLTPFLPKKILKIKKSGVQKDQVKPLYPGYIFIFGYWDLSEAKVMLKTPGAVKFIGGINAPGILTKEEKELIAKITKNGVAEYSKVIKIGSKIKIVSGQLKELEGVIESVDRRKQKAVVKLPLLNSIVKVTLGFEYINENENK